MSVCLIEGRCNVNHSPDIAPPASAASLIETRQIMSCHERSNSWRLITLALASLNIYAYLHPELINIYGLQFSILLITK